MPLSSPSQRVNLVVSCRKKNESAGAERKGLRSFLSFHCGFEIRSSGKVLDYSRRSGSFWCNLKVQKQFQSFPPNQAAGLPSPTMGVSRSSRSCTKLKLPPNCHSTATESHSRNRQIAITSSLRPPRRRSSSSSSTTTTTTTQRPTMRAEWPRCTI